MTQHDVDAIDKAESRQFMERFMKQLNSAAVVHMVSLGNRTGLLDAMADLAPSTSTEIAAATGLQERYVREWLGSLTAGGVIQYDPAAGTYRLPAEHAAFLTRAAGPRNLSTMAKLLCSVGQVEAQVARCFREGGGVPYSAYPEFHAFQGEASGARHDAALVSTILPLVDGVIERLQAGIDVADVGCGTGHAINVMAAAFPASRFVGFDLSELAIDGARTEAAAMGLTNARFEVADAADLCAGPFDFITTFDAVHDQARPADMVTGIAAALKSDGTWLCVDIAGSGHLESDIELPMAPFFYATSTLHCMTVSLAYDGEGLGSMWGEERARQLFVQAGFASVHVHKSPGDPFNNYYVCQKEPELPNNGASGC